MRPPDDKIDVEGDATEADVGNEGGSQGDVELAREHGPGTGSEAGETWRPTDDRVEPIRRDETGEGRRSP
jgi:hypothetical protein